MKWALDMKKTIADYLKLGSDGAFFYRMVETVLSRDKNWVRWKISNCPSIAKEAVQPDTYIQAKAAAQKATTNKRLRPNPLGSLDLKFLKESNDITGLERLKKPSRYELPSVKSFENKIGLDDFDIEMEMDPEKKNAATESKASKSWRALRIASTSKLVTFDQIVCDEQIGALFKDDTVTDIMVNGDEEADEEESSKLPIDRRPIVISGPRRAGKSALIMKLAADCGKSLIKQASHTTRPRLEGEREGIDHIFVNQEQFSMIRDADDFLEYIEKNDVGYGTSRKLVEAIATKGKVAVLEVNHSVSCFSAGYYISLTNK